MQTGKDGVWTLEQKNENYPSLLREIPHPPKTLYGRGNFEILDENKTGKINLAMVGTRRPTGYGTEAAEKIAGELCRAGVVIVSGLAAGIDSAAHKAAVQNNGITIAVLGSGIDEKSIFPGENIYLAQKIVKTGGAVISEHPPGTPALPRHFPQRNRIISGLCRGVIVAEAREKSGALITARFALEQNREVFAVPGQIFSPTSLGPHKLIKEGAKIACSAQDVLEEFGIDCREKTKSETAAFLSREENEIFALLEEPQGIDVMRKKTGKSAQEIKTVVSLLELKDLVKNIGGDFYQRTEL